MGERLRTEVAEALFERVKPMLQEYLQYIEAARFTEAAPLLSHARGELSGYSAPDQGEALLSDLYVLEKYAGLLKSYAEAWQLIWQGEYANSWGALQDALDGLRLVKKFSRIDIAFFENQLVELEGAYPYRVFASIGAIVEHFECSICALDIDGVECSHRKGELYAGKLAYGIARNVTSLDHVSLVLNPDDKRCVMQVVDTPLQFPILTYIRDQWIGGTFRLGWLSRLEWSKREVPNPAYERRGRNDPCYCGSAAKFKNCCSNHHSILQDHVELVGDPKDIRDAVV